MIIYGSIGDNCVLQENTPFSIKGNTAAKDFVTGRLIGKIAQTVTATMCEKGDFSLNFEGIEGGFDEYKIIIECGGDSVIYDGIVFGVLFMAAGQSNMEYQLEYTERAEQNHKLYANAFFRFADISNAQIDNTPQGFMGSLEMQKSLPEFRWVRSDEDFGTVKNTSAYAYICCGKIFKKLNKPVGYINTSLGGSGIQNWLPRDLVFDDERFSELRKFDSVAGNKTVIGSLYNTKIHPLEGTAFHGILWYQGESSAWNYADAFSYRFQLNGLMDFYRCKFGGNLKFLLVNIAIEYYTPYGSDVLNESINQAAEDNGFAVSCPIYDLPHRWFLNDGKLLYHPIHLTSKTESALRGAKLYYNAFIAQKTYGCAYLKCFEVKGNYIYAAFETFGKKLCAKGRIFGFTVAGEGGNYVPACAEIVSYDTVKLSSKYIKNPQNCAYAFFMSNNQCNLRCNNLPVIPFRTDRKETALERFCAVEPALECGLSKTYENTFSAVNGGAGEIAAWRAGELFGSKKCRISHKNGYTEFKFNQLKDAYYYIGFTPEILHPFTENIFGKYLFADIDLQSENDIEFIGLHVRLSNGEQFCMPAADNGQLQQFYNIKSGERTEFTVDLHRIFHFTGCESSVNGDTLKKVARCQISFRYLGERSNTVKLYGIHFHD